MSEILQKDIAEQLRQERFTTKNDLLAWIKNEEGRINDNSKTDKKHSSAFYYAYSKILQNFYAAIEKAVLFDRLEDYWYYSLGISYAGASLSLVHVSKCWVGDAGTVVVTSDQEYTLITIRGKMLSVEEYAAEYNVGAGTVRQWIRRGKIRSAIKVGKEWVIPELTELPERGYQSASYMYYEKLDNCPDEYSYLENYSTVIINQNRKDRTMFDVILAAARTKPKTLTMDTKEREKLELFLISHPKVHYIDGPSDGLNIAISTKDYINKDLI